MCMFSTILTQKFTHFEGKPVSNSLSQKVSAEGIIIQSEIGENTISTLFRFRRPLPMGYVWGLYIIRVGKGRRM